MVKSQSLLHVLSIKKVFEKKRIGVTELLSSFENKNKSTTVIYNGPRLFL